MREILFRGKSVKDGTWFIGQLLHFESPVSEKELNVIVDGCEWDDVVPETVGQFTGFNDKNGKRIFEGDIIRKTNKGRHPEIFTANIRTDFRVKEEVYYGPFEHFTESCEYEIIGNIHDDPELLKEGDIK